MRQRVEEKELRAFAKAWGKNGNLADEMIPHVLQLDQDRKRAVENSFIMLMAASHSLRHRTLFPDWAGQGTVCGEIDIQKRPESGASIGEAIILADRIDDFIRQNAEAFDFSETGRYVDVGETHALVKDGTVKYIGKKDDE